MNNADIHTIYRDTNTEYTKKRYILVIHGITEVGEKVCSVEGIFGGSEARIQGIRQDMLALGELKYHPNIHVVHDITIHEIIIDKRNNCKCQNG